MSLPSNERRAVQAFTKTNVVFPSPSRTQSALLAPALVAVPPPPGSTLRHSNPMPTGAVRHSEIPHRPTMISRLLGTTLRCAGRTKQ
jgi:hypothetical protein